MNQKIYNETRAACLAGGMTDDASEEYAQDMASRKPGSGNPHFNPVKVPTRFSLPMGFSYEPGNGTRFEVYLAPHYSGGVLVSLLNFNTCHLFPFPPHPSYVAEKLALLSRDAEEMAKLISAQFMEEA